MAAPTIRVAQRPLTLSLSQRERGLCGRVAVGFNVPFDPTGLA